MMLISSINKKMHTFQRVYMFYPWLLHKCDNKHCYFLDFVKLLHSCTQILYVLDKFICCSYINNNLISVIEIDPDKYRLHSFLLKTDKDWNELFDTAVAARTTITCNARMPKI